MKTVVVIPTYNEADNLPAICAELWALPLEDLSILVVDDNSPDGTGAVADELAAAAGLLIGQAAEGVPVVLIRGADYPRGEGRAVELQRPPERDLFR